MIIKLDFAKAFDTVNWTGLLTVLKARGFNQTWQQWILQLLCTSKNAVLLNGVPGPWFTCKRGLRQGDPLSPLLFILCVDPLHRLLEAATRTDVLNTILGTAARMRTSLYADDAVIFINPVRQEIDSLLELLQQFGDATGLRVNLSKSSAVPIRCDDIDIGVVL